MQEAARGASPRHPSGRVNNGTEASRQAVFPKSRAPRRLSPSPRRKKIRFPHPRRLAISTSLIPRPSPHFFLLVRPSTASSSVARGVEKSRQTERGFGEEKKGNLSGFPFREILGAPPSPPLRARRRWPGSRAPPGPPRRASFPPGNVWPSFAAANVAVWIGRVLLTLWCEQLQPTACGIVALGRVGGWACGRG